MVKEKDKSCKNRPQERSKICVRLKISVCAKEEKEAVKSWTVTYETCPLSISTHPFFSMACPHPSQARAPSRPPAAGGWEVTPALPSFQYVSREKDSHHITSSYLQPRRYWTLQRCRYKPHAATLTPEEDPRFSSAILIFSSHPVTPEYLLTPQPSGFLDAL